jgi:hypothetical protein
MELSLKWGIIYVDTLKIYWDMAFETYMYLFQKQVFWENLF